ncbi:hypothetical protein EX895_004145 [Sporisorium graminicola]|uniref:Class II aldolase/adducin N-terminal domain-containing protein n=1 Tax=Sporisorium graminicola TaxID=280036 RepID=A0A4U7KS87_9BASI|nr:hypothetical protein EX895_004145 [Sporisorium graminicola]TKY86857.1 hypothetical protein EX895_004145 [Sporisorium graminicola]
MEMTLFICFWPVLVLVLGANLVVSQSGLPTLTPRQLAVNQLVNASRILAYQGIADGSPGHISIRDPFSPSTAFLISANTRTAAQITPADIAVVRINDSIVTSAALDGYAAPARPAEVFIHSSIYQRFPNTTVSSIAYYSSEQLLPWTLFTARLANGTSADATVSDVSSLYAATSGASFMGSHPAPVFNAFDAEPNTTSVNVDSVVKGFDLAQKFGPAGTGVQTVNQSDGFRPLVLMRNDGATVVGTSVPEVVFRFIQAAKSARVQYHAASLLWSNGTAPLFLPTAATKTTDDYLRSWLYWMTQIEPSINADSTRSPELWKGSGASSAGSGSGSKGTSGAAGKQPDPCSTAMLALVATVLHAVLL